MWVIAPFPSDNVKLVVRKGVNIVGYFVFRSGGIWSEKSAKFLSPYKGGVKGYPVVALRFRGETLRCSVHQLVAEAFIGPRPAGMDTAHNDGNVENNAVENIRYASRRDNLADRVQHGTAQIGERNPAAVLSDYEAQQIRDRRRSGEKLKVLATAYGVSESAICQIANGKRRAT